MKNLNTKTTIHFVESSKGAAGVSTVSLALADYLASRGSVLVVDADTSNHDVADRLKNAALPIITMPDKLTMNEWLPNFLEAVESFNFNGVYQNIVISLPVNAHINPENIRLVKRRFL